MTPMVHAGLAGIARRRQRRAAVIMGTLAAVFSVAVLLSAGWGAVSIAPDRFAAILAAQIGIDLPWEYTAQQEVVLLAIRLPRVGLAILSGAALAVAGASLQGLFRNPLADPGLIGVSTSAALAAVAVIVLGGAVAQAIPYLPISVLLPFAAFSGGLVGTFVVYRIATRDGRTDVPTMLLGGVAINAIAAAGIGCLVFISTDQQLRDLNFWMLGSLGGATWGRLLPAAPFIAAGLLLLPLFSRYLNAMLLGEDDAGHLGFDVERSKRWIVVLSALAVGASVALTGVVGFVGLLVPHLVRMFAGPDHGSVLPGSILLGASLMLIADLLARSVVLPAELPIGIVTSCVGGPFFLWLLMRRRAIGGW